MYNYLMSHGGWKPHRDTLSLDRFAAARNNPQFALVNKVAPPELLTLPALLMPEVDDGSPQIARVATITSAREGSRGVLTIEYTLDPYIPPIPVKKIVQLSDELDIQTGGFALTHTHWAVRNADLFRVLLQHGATARPQASVFKLDDGNQDEKLIGVMMPFAAEYKGVYKAIQKAAASAGFKCVRADDIWLHHHVMQTIVSLICQSGIVVADCTTRNPNVFYEVGIAHTLGRDVILLAQSMSDVPFDLRSLHVITYLDNRQGLGELTTKLKERIEDVAKAQKRT